MNLLQFKAVFFSNSSNDKLVDERYCWHASSRPPISTQIYRRIAGDHPCGNFYCISLQKFSRNNEEFFIRIFPFPFSIVSLRIFPHEYFPHTSLKISKRNTRTQEGFELCNKHHSVDLMSFFGELKCFQVWGNFHLISISPEFPCGFPFHF